MAYIFSSYQTVPENVIREIASDIKRELAIRLECDKFEDRKIISILNEIDQAVNNIVNDNIKSVNGYKLRHEDALEIATCLKNHKRIDAIKEFRRATGEGLKESKEVIDQFEIGDSGFIQFMNSFT